MPPAAFKAWRQRLGLTQTEAGDAIGVSLRAVQFYEAGERPISRTVALACAAVALGIKDLPGDRAAPD